MNTIPLIKKIPVICFLILALTGCTAVDDKINAQYEKVGLIDGVTREEALTVAQKNFLDSAYKGAFDIARPQVETGPSADKYPNLWFVTFPRTKEYTDNAYHVVVIDKRTGGILRSQEWRDKEKGFDWIFIK